MGESQVYEALRKKAGKPAVPEWPEIFSAARPKYTGPARRLLKGLDLDAAADKQLRRRIATALRTYWGHRLGVKVFAEYEARALEAEAALTNLLPLFQTPPPALLGARDWFRERQKWPRAPKGFPRMPFLDGILADILADSPLERSEACALLRAAGIPVPAGRALRQ